MSRTARTLADVLLGEAVSGSRAQRFEDMVGIMSTIANRAAATGASIEDVISAKNQYSAYGKSLPPGVERYRDLAQQAIEHVQKYGPATTAQFYATPAASSRLPSGLSLVGQTRGHRYFEDPQARAIRTAVGFRKPGSVAYDVMPEDTTAVPDDALDAIFGFGPQTASPASALDDDLDAVFGLGTATSAQPSRETDLDAVFGLSTPASSATAGNIDDDVASTWNGSFSNPVGAVTDRVTSGFGPRTAPETSLGVGSSLHAGIDLSARPGATGYPAEAAAPGVVSFAGPRSGYGLSVEIEHPNGYTSRYGHLQEVDVQVGDEIARGTPIGLVGATGNVSGGHLHFEVRDEQGNAIDPSSVVDFARRDLAVTPTSRPMSPTEQRNTTAAYSGMAASMANSGALGIGRAAPASPGLPSAFDTTRFAGEIDPARFGGLSYGGPSAPVSPVSGYAAAESRMPSSERFGWTADIDPARFGGRQGGVSVAGHGGPFSPAGSYARAEAPAAEPSAQRFGGQTVADMPSPERFGREPSMPSMGSVAAPYSPAGAYATAAAGQSLDIGTPSPVRPDNANYSGPKGQFSVNTPMASIADPVTTSGLRQGLAGTVLGVPASSTQTLPSSVSAFAPLPGNVAPIGPATAFTPALRQYAPPAPAIPAPVSVPMPAAKLAPSTPAKGPTPTSRPQFSATDVWGGSAPVGYQASATGGNLVSRDAFGNTSITNSFGVTTTFDRDGRMVGTMDSKLGAAIGRAAPGILGSALGAAVGGPIGGILGGLAGRSMAGQRPGGLLGALFGGGSLGGGRSSSGGSTSGGRSSSGRGPGADRDHAGF